MSLIPESLPKSIADWLAPRLHFTESLPHPAATLLARDGSIEIHVGKHYLAASPAVRELMLLHEMSHVIRGDIYIKDVEPAVFNIATDSLINRLLDSKAQDELDALIQGQTVRWEQVAKYIGLDPKHCHVGWRTIYDKLMEKAPKECSGCGLKGGQEQSGGGAADRAELAKALREGGHGHLAEGFRGAAPQGHGNLQDLEVKPWREPLLDSILRAVRSVRFGGARIPRRTYKREGRGEGYKGTHRLPKTQIRIAVDVSGSMCAILSQIAGLAKGASWLEPEFATFDTELTQWGRRFPSAPAQGGGTLFGPPLAWGQGSDVLVMLTDGEPADPHAVPPACPVVWVIPEGARVNATVRSSDRVVAVKL